MAAALPTGTVTFLFTDIEGSTQLLQRLGDHYARARCPPRCAHCRGGAWRAGPPLIDDLPADFPPLKTLNTHRNNLPIQPTPLLGRQDQVAALCALLRREDVRLVTLTGPGAD